PWTRRPSKTSAISYSAMAHLAAVAAPPRCHVRRQAGWPDRRRVLRSQSYGVAGRADTVVGGDRGAPRGESIVPCRVGPPNGTGAAGGGVVPGPASVFETAFVGLFGLEHYLDGWRTPRDVPPTL